jgi:hypothetical protein
MLFMRQSSFAGAVQISSKLVFDEARQTIYNAYAAGETAAPSVYGYAAPWTARTSSSWKKLADVKIV